MVGEPATSSVVSAPVGVVAAVGLAAAVGVVAGGGELEEVQPPTLRTHMGERH